MNCRLLATQSYTEFHGQVVCRLTSTNISYKKRLVFVRIIVDDCKNRGAIVFFRKQDIFFNDALQHKSLSLKRDLFLIYFL